MLGKTWRVVAWNNTGVALGATDIILAQVLRRKFDSTGQRSDESTPVNLFSSTAGNSLASGGYVAGITQDNNAASTFWLNGDIYVKGTVSTAVPNGTIVFYYQTSHDGGTTWPANGKGDWLASLTFTATGTQDDNVRF